MEDLRFTWDPRKASENLRKHGVEFEEAQTVFLDDYALLIADPEHSEAEDRFLLLGVSAHEKQIEVSVISTQNGVIEMRKRYDFSKAKRNPYAKRLKRQITIRLDEPTIEYFKQLAEKHGIPYQTLINLYLRDCAVTGRNLSMRWKATG